MDRYVLLVLGTRDRDPSFPRTLLGGPAQMPSIEGAGAGGRGGSPGGVSSGWGTLFTTLYCRFTVDIALVLL